MEYTKEHSGLSNWYKKLQYLFKDALTKKQKTYILPTSFGLVYGLLCFVLLLMGMAYGNNLVYVVCFYLTVMGLALAKKTNDQIDLVQIEDVFTKEVFAEDQQTLFVNLQNKSMSHLRRIEIKIARETFVFQVDLKPKEMQTVELLWHPPKRGLQKLPMVRIQSSYPSGLFRAWKVFKQKKEGVIFARRAGVHNFPESSFASADSIGILKEIRDYVPGDSPKRIHWRSLAKNTQLRTLVHEGNEGQTCHIHWREVDHLPFEQRIEQLTLWISLAHSQNIPWNLKLPEREFGSHEAPPGPKAALNYLALWNAS